MARPPLAELAEREGRAGVEQSLSELIQKVNSGPSAASSAHGDAEPEGSEMQPLPLEGETTQ